MTQKSKGLMSIGKRNSDFHFHTDRQGSNGPRLPGPRNKMTNDPIFPPTSTATMFPNSSSSPSTTLAPGENCPMDDSSLQIPLALSYGLLFVLGLVGNALALWVFLCVHAKKNSVRVFLINTALADLLLVGCLPFRVLYHSRGNSWQLGSFMCSVVGNLFYMNMYISITLLGLISMDRYLKIKRSVALQSRLQATRWSTAICTVIWIVFSVVALAFLVSNKNEDQKCFQYKSLHMDKWKAYINFTVVGGFWLIFVALVVSYGKIGMHLLGTSRANPALPNASRYTRTAKKSFFVLFLFTVCFVPYHVLRLFYITSQITSTSCAWQAVVDRANEVSLLFSTLNSCLDPVMYFLLSSSVRRETLRLVGAVLRLRGRGVGVSGSSSSAEQGGFVGRGVQTHSADS